jgi:UDP-glucose 4-epimerase
VATSVDLRGKSILVTGATGFIGGALAARLSQQGASVHAVAGHSGRSLAAGPSWWRTDLLDLGAVRALLSEVKPEVVYHLAGHVSGVRELAIVIPSLRDNLLTTVHLLTAAAESGKPRIILAASLEEPEPDGSWPVPSSPYAASKFAASTYARMFHALYGTAAVMLRTFIVYGPGQPDVKKLIPYVTRALLRGEAPRLSSGSRPVDWVYIDDVIDAYITAATAPGLEGRTCEIGTGTLATVREVVERLARIIQPRSDPVFGAVAERPMEQVRCAHPEEARAWLGWEARISLDEGLRRTVEWYRRQTARSELP